MILVYLIEFVLFSFIGWIIDSGYRSAYEKKWINAGYFKGLVCPIYGFGGLALVFVFKYLGSFDTYLLVLIATLAMIVIEYLGGIFSEKVLKMKLWDYSTAKFHLGGHVDLLHSIYWLILVLFFNYFIFPKVIWFESLISYPEILEIPSFLIFVLVALWLTIRRSPDRFLEIKGKFADLSVTEYKNIFSNIKKMNRAKTVLMKTNLERKIRDQLKNTGAYLKNFKF